MVKAKGSETEKTQLISQKEMSDRENKMQHNLADISVSCNYIKESTNEFNRLEEERAQRDHWEHHIRCDGLPRPYLPPEMRTFLAEKRHYQQFDYDYSVDWTLSVDETTVLTQDIFRTDRTLKTMKDTLDDHIGDRYQKDVFMYLDTITKIDLMLDNNAEMARVEFARQMEIMETRREIEKEIDSCFDRLTYRIIRMDGVYMNSEDAMVATWGHKCDRYAIDIWGLRNVPIRFREMLAPLMEAELEHVDATVQMPLSVLHDCLTLRCIHTSFDNYSQYAKSYDPIINENAIEPTAGIIDIEDSLISEWLMQLDIQDELLMNMLEKREVYEEIMRIIVEKTEKAAKDKKANEGKNVKAPAIPKAPKEPPSVPPGMLPDAYSTFLEREQQQYLDMLDDMYNPANLKLMLDEINLRQHIMLGGLYSIMFVRRPGNTHFQKFNIILHEDGRILHTMEDVVADLRKPQEDDLRRSSKLSYRDSNLSASRSKSRMRLNMDENKRKTLMLEDDELPYFFVTLHLPLELCMWGEPIVCQYMTTMQEVVSDTSLTEDKKESVMSKKERKKSKIEAMRVASEVVERPSQFRLIQRKDKDSVNVFRPTLISLLRRSKRPRAGEKVVAVRNFPLDQKLEHVQIRQLERYCVPRVISSFKFPQEVREELELAFDNRPKARNILMRRRSADVEEVLDFGELDFDFDKQHAPERMFPVFHDMEQVPYCPEDINVNTFDRKSIYGLLETFDTIKLQFTNTYRQIMNQPDFEMKKPEKPKKTVVPVLENRQSAILAKPKSLLKASSSRQTSFRGSQAPMLSATTSAMSTARGSSTAHLPDSASHVDTHEPHLNMAASTISVAFEEKEEKPKVKVVHWTTQHIIESKFDRKARTMTIRTDRLGVFGLAFKRYEHFPFRDWNMHPNDENPEEIILTVDTFHVRVILYITNQGVRGYVTDLSKTYVAKPFKYLEIVNPIQDFRLLRRRFCEKNINIFAEHDASYYIDNGYFSVKHVATEDHIYDAMALHCKLMKFYRSSWNRLASRRNVLMGMKNAKDQSDYTEVTVRITPDHVTFVEVSELCSDDLDIIKLDFKTTWRNMSHYTDLHQAINSMNPHATDVRNRDPLLLYQIKKMLSELHILNFS